MKRQHPNDFTPLASFPKPATKPPRPTARTEAPPPRFILTVLATMTTRHRPTAEALALTAREDLEVLGFEVKIKLTND